MGLAEIYAMKDLYRNKTFCDVGFGRGNILHAVYPYVKSLIGYELESSVGNHAYESTEELLFLKEQKDKELDLIYKDFSNSGTPEQFQKIDFFYCTVGIQNFVKMNVDRIFRVNPRAVLMHYFKMTDVGFETWELVDGRRPVYPASFPGFSSSMDSSTVISVCMSESLYATGGMKPQLGIVSKDKGDTSVTNYFLLYGPDDIVTKEIKDSITSTFSLGYHSS